jgi:hypothetical protein
MLCCVLFQMLPTLVDASVLENETAVSVSCGSRHTAILTGWFSVLLQNNNTRIAPSYILSAMGRNAAVEQTLLGLGGLRFNLVAFCS